jgi:hypothetical protein
MNKVKVNVYNKASEKMVRRQLRLSNGRFASKLPRILFYTFAIILVFIFAYASKHSTKIEYKEVEKVIVLNTTQQIIDSEKKDILDVLEKCESNGNVNAIAWEDYGVGKNRASFGAFMLKVGTIQHFNKDLTDFQAIALASDTARARELSQYIIFETKDGIRNWKNCMDKHNLLSRVNFVKELESKVK